MLGYMVPFTLWILRSVVGLRDQRQGRKFILKMMFGSEPVLQFWAEFELEEGALWAPALSSLR
jgi:hypothetical protein